MQIDDLKDKKVADLRAIAKSLDIAGCAGMKKADLIEVISVVAAAQEDKAPAENTGNQVNENKAKTRNVVPDKEDGRFEVEGILEIADQPGSGGFGFLRFHNFLTSDRDIYVAPAQVRRFNLKTGDKIRGIARPPRDSEKFGALLYVVTVNDDEPGVAVRVNFHYAL